MSYQKFQECIEACLDCAIECERCSAACLKEQDVKMMVKCIQLDRDCADICTVAARLLARVSKHGIHMMKECAEVCDKCAEECEKHGQMEHCKVCADACRKCAEECRNLATQLA